MMHLFVINPKSFKDVSGIRAVEEEIARCFASADDYHVHVSRYPRDAVGIVGKFAARFSDGIRVYAVGGDGILFDCLNGLVGYPDAELAAVPYGSTNDFARAIGEGNTEKFRNIGALLTAPSVLTDIIHCGSNYFLNFCAIGLESAAIIKWYRMQAKLFNPRNKRLVNWILTLSGTLSLLDKNLVNQYYEVKIDSREYSGNYVVINFSNGPCYGGDKTAVPEAVFNDGFVDVLLVKSVNRLKLLSLIPGYLTGRYSEYPDYITHIRAKEITINSNRPMFVNLDGECFLDTTIKLKVMPSAVKTIAAGGSAFVKEARS